MNDFEKTASQWLSVALGMWARRWYGVLAAWLVGAVGVVAMVLIPQRYEASARIYVDTQSMLKPLMKGLTVQPDAEQQVMMLSRMLVSRDNMDRLVVMADLASGDASSEDRDALIDYVTHYVEVKSAGRDNVYTLSYRDPDPATAQRVVESLVKIFLESNRSLSRNESKAAQAFIESQIPVYRGKLEEAEQRLKEFRLRHVDVPTSSSADLSSRVSDLAAELNKVRLELREAEDAHAAAKAALQREMQQQAVATPEVDARIDSERRRLDGLLQRYGDAHPDVRSSRELLASLEERRRADVAELRSGKSIGPVGTTVTKSAASQELTKVLANWEVQLAALRTRANEYSSRYEQALAHMKAFPQLEAEWSQLNRDYGVHKKNFEDLLARRESALMSVNVESASGIAEMRLIDPPRVSSRPVTPARKLLLPLVLCGSLAAGMAVAFVMSQLQPLCHRAMDLRQHFDVPLLGVVSLAGGRASAARGGGLAPFAVAAGGLVALFVVGMVVLGTADKI
jgi:polysaccharide chain length determinant protein (PEP-CTERM system associated)